MCETIQEASAGIFKAQNRSAAPVRVTLVGVYHDLQWTDLTHRETHRKRYQQIITDEVGHSLRAAVLEEAGNNEHRSFARQLADKREVLYQNIDIGQDARAKIEHIDINGLCLEGNTMRENIHARAWNMAREHHMMESVRIEVFKVMNTEKEGRVLVICGLSHLDAIHEHLAAWAPDVPVVGHVFHHIAP